MGSWKKVILLSVAAAAVLLLPARNAAAQDDCYGRLPVEPISLNLRDTNAATTLRLLSRQYRVNMVVTEDVKGAVTLDFFQVPARDVFRAIIETSGFRCVIAAGVLRVSTAAKFKQEEEERAKAEDAKAKAEAETKKKQQEAAREEATARREQEKARREQEEYEAIKARGAVKEVTIRLSYADAEEVAKTLLGILGLPPEGLTPPPAPLPAIYQPLAPTVIGAPPAPAAPTTPAPAPSAEALAKGLTVRAHKPTNSIFIRYYENDLERITRLIKEQLDIPLPQVQIAAQMVITSRNALEQLGIQWGGAAFGRPGGSGGPVILGTGFSQVREPQPGVTISDSFPTGTGVAVGGNNPNFTGSGFLAVDPSTGLPARGRDSGNLINLPLSFLPTVANPALGVLFGIVGRDFNFNLAIQALEVQGKAKSLAEPKVVTVENAKAVISRGFEVPFVSASQAGTNVQFKDALLQLQVTPNVIQENGTTKIRMKVLVENNEPDFTRAVAGNPPLFKRRAESEVVIKEGERLVIGGVLIENTNNTVRQVPLLGRIPVLGWLFKSREESVDGQELIVIITPSVVAKADRPGQR